MRGVELRWRHGRESHSCTRFCRPLPNYSATAPNTPTSISNRDEIIKVNWSKWYTKSMSKNKSWTDDQLIEYVAASFSYRMVIGKLGLVPAGGNYDQVKRRIKELSLDVSHFTGARWNVGERRKQTRFGRDIESLLVNGGEYQSYKLKKKLFLAGLKFPKCEICGWAEKADDGRIPLELDHINGNRKDNRIENLRVLCPNCHSLQPTHRGKNKKANLARVL